MAANSAIAIGAAPGWEWDIQLSQLDEGELASIEEFFLGQSGSVRQFRFHGPIGRDGVRQLQRSGGHPDIAERRVEMQGARSSPWCGNS